MNSILLLKGRRQTFGAPRKRGDCHEKRQGISSFITCNFIIAQCIFLFGQSGFMLAQMIIIAHINSVARANAELLLREMPANNTSLFH